jgi:cytochrome c
MDVLKTLASPPSIEHYHLLLLIGALVSIVLYPYLGFLLGTSFLSNRYRQKGKREDNPLYLRFAKNLAETALVNKSVPTVFAILPALSLVFVYAQVLQATDSIAVSLAGFGCILLTAAVVLLYAYKYTFRLGDVLEGYKRALQRSKSEADGKFSLEEYADANFRSHEQFGRYGVVLIVAAAFLVTSAFAVAGNPAHWQNVDSFLSLFLSLDVYLRFLQFLALAAGATGFGMLFVTFSWDKTAKTPDPEYSGFVKTVSMRMVTGSLLTLPVFLMLGYLLLPGESLSGILYALAGLSLGFLLLAAQFVYAFEKEQEPRHAASALFVFGCAVALLGVNDQVALYNATKGQAAFLSYRHETEIEDLKSKLGVAGVVFTGEDIFNAKCSACHTFDAKKVGPAYKDVLPKYVGRKEQMMAFVLNPIKIDPAFPPMPGQGLKPAEADSIVSYLLRKIAPARPNAETGTPAVKQ